MKNTVKLELHYIEVLELIHAINITKKLIWNRKLDEYDYKNLKLTYKNSKKIYKNYIKNKVNNIEINNNNNNNKKNYNFYKKIKKYIGKKRVM